MPDTITAVIVSYNEPQATRVALESLLAQSVPPLEALLVDNAPGAPLAAALGSLLDDSRVRIVQRGANLGYTAAANLAAAQAHGEWLLFLNPDARAEPDCLATLLEAAGGGAAILGAQVLLPDGRVNAGDNPVHITGLAWAGRYGEPREHAPPRAVASVSGAALMIRADVFHDLSGMCERFFLYQDDVDLCWRARLAGWDVAYVPEAAVIHDYAFDAGAQKWYWLERNRVWCVASNYALVTLVLLTPLLLATELAVAARATRDGWLGGYLRAWRSNLAALPEWLAWRRTVQATRGRRDGELLRTMTARFETPLLPSRSASAAAAAMEGYRGLVLRALGARARDRAAT